MEEMNGKITFMSMNSFNRSGQSSQVSYFLCNIACYHIFVIIDSLLFDTEQVIKGAHLATKYCAVCILNIYFASEYVKLPDSREQHMAEFMEWMNQNGTETTCVEIHKFPSQGYGLKATKSIDVRG